MDSRLGSGRIAICNRSRPEPAFHGALLHGGCVMSYELLKRAIEAHRPLTGVYDDYVRFFSPVVLGKSATGEPSVLCFQYGGGQPVGSLPPGGAWRLFMVRRLRRLGPSGDAWIVGPLDIMPSHLIAKVDLAISTDQQKRA